MLQRVVTTLVVCLITLCVVLPSNAIPLGTPTPTPTPTSTPTPTPIAAIPDPGAWGADDDTDWVPRTSTPESKATTSGAIVPTPFHTPPSSTKDSLITVNVVGILSVTVVVVVVLLVIGIVYCYHTYETTRLTYALQVQALRRRTEHV